MIRLHRCRSIDFSSSAALRVPATFVLAVSTALAAPGDNSNGDIALPPPPAYATPASAMR